MEREYLDARFDSLEKILTLQEANLKSYINAVSSNVREVRIDLQAHKDSAEAHGAGAVNRKDGSVMGWIGAISGAIGIAIALWTHK